MSIWKNRNDLCFVRLGLEHLGDVGSHLGVDKGPYLLSIARMGYVGMQSKSMATVHTINHQTTPKWVSQGKSHGWFHNCTASTPFTHFRMGYTYLMIALMAAYDIRRDCESYIIDGANCDLVTMYHRYWLSTR